MGLYDDLDEQAYWRDWEFSRDEPVMPTLDELATDLSWAKEALEDLGYRSIAQRLEAVIVEIDNASDAERMLKRFPEIVAPKPTLSKKQKKKQKQAEARKAAAEKKIATAPVVEKKRALPALKKEG